MTAGIGVLAAALAPPLERMAAERFAAHMAQHLMLLLVAAPLIAAARPVTVAVAALPDQYHRALHRPLSARLRRAVRRLRHPLVVWLLGTAVLWAWHSPGLYQLALRSGAVHTGEHLTLLGSAGLFWSVVIGAGAGRVAGRRGAGARPAAVALVFATALSSGALGAALTFAGAPLYPEQAAVVAATGADPLADQQLAGALMWVPPGLVYLAVMVGLVVGWFAELDRRTAPQPAGPLGGPALREPAQ